MKKNHANEPAYRLKLYFHELLHFISSGNLLIMGLFDIS